MAKMRLISFLLSTIAIAGQFTTCDGEPRTNFALLRGDTTPSDYELWLAAHGLPSGSSPSLDGDGDKRGLGIEFAYRLNPHARDTMAILDADAEGARIAPPQQRGVQVEGWFSENLGGWQPVPVGADWTMNGPGGTSGPTGFFRFELTPGP